MKREITKGSIHHIDINQVVKDHQKQIDDMKFREAQRQLFVEHLDKALEDMLQYRITRTDFITRSKRIAELIYLFDEREKNK